MSSSIGKNIHAPLAGCGRIVTESLGPTQHCAGWQQGKWAKVLAGDTALHPVSLAEKTASSCWKVTQSGEAMQSPEALHVQVSQLSPGHFWWVWCAFTLVFGAHIIEGFVALFRWSAKIRCALSFVPRFQLFGVSMGWVYLTINKHGSEVYSKMRFSKLSFESQTAYTRCLQHLQMWDCAQLDKVLHVFACCFFCWFHCLSCRRLSRESWIDRMPAVSSSPCDLVCLHSCAKDLIG